MYSVKERMIDGQIVSNRVSGYILEHFFKLALSLALSLYICPLKFVSCSLL